MLKKNFYCLVSADLLYKIIAKTMDSYVLYDLSLETLRGRRKGRPHNDIGNHSQQISFNIGWNHMSGGEGMSCLKCELALRKPLGS